MSLKRTEIACCNDCGSMTSLPSWPSPVARRVLSSAMGNAQRLVHIDPVTEQVGPHPFDHAGNFDGLAVDAQPDGLFGGIHISQFGQIPQDERGDEQRQKDRRDVAAHPLQQIFHVSYKKIATPA